MIDTEDDGPCNREVAPEARWHICDGHLGDIFYGYRSHMTRVRDDDGTERVAVDHRAAVKRSQGPAYTEHVYYVRFGDRVKIGFSSNLDTRLSSLPHDEVLAIEPGGRQLEQMRHAQFGVARIYANREWFVLTDEIRSHCAMLVQHFGQPYAFLRRTQASPRLPTTV